MAYIYGYEKHLAEMFEDDPKRCEKYNRIYHKLSAYMDLDEDETHYMIDDRYCTRCIVDFERT